MEQHPTPTQTPATATTATEPPPPQPQPQPPPPPQPLQQEQSAPPSAATTPTTTSTPTPNPNPNTPQPSKPTLAPPQPRPSSFSRPWQQQQHSHFAHFSSLPSSSPSSSSITPPIPASQRGGIAIGVPAPRPTASTPQPAAPFSSSFGQQFGGLGRTGVNTPDSVSPSQLRPQVQGMQGMGMMGSIGSSSQMRPGGISVQHHQPRPLQQSSLRPTPSSPNNQSSATQNFQGQSLMRVSSVGSPGSPSPSTSQSTHNQPWLSSGPQGKPPLPPPTSYRPQMNSPSMQQRSHIPQPHIPLSTAAQQQHVPSVQPQPKTSHQLQEHHGQQFPSSRVSQSLPHQQQITRTLGSAIQKPSSLGMVQPTAVQAGNQTRIVSAESDESCNRILSKRSINEIVNQIEPSERLDPEVEDILVDIAEDFVDSITTFGCSLAKHRKSDTLEAKDILLHLERNWNMTLPGFGGDEIKTYRKPHTNDIHKERLAVIKKSIMATEVANMKTSVGQATATAKGNLGKVPANILGST